MADTAPEHQTVEIKPTVYGNQRRLTFADLTPSRIEALIARMREEIEEKATTERAVLVAEAEVEFVLRLDAVGYVIPEQFGGEDAKHLIRGIQSSYEAARGETIRVVIAPAQSQPDQ